jgi:hypothetical protein
MSRWGWRCCNRCCWLVGKLVARSAKKNRCKSVSIHGILSLISNSLISQSVPRLRLSCDSLLMSHSTTVHFTCWIQLACNCCRRYKERGNIRKHHLFAIRQHWPSSLQRKLGKKGVSSGSAGYPYCSPSLVHG